MIIPFLKILLNRFERLAFCERISIIDKDVAAHDSALSQRLFLVSVPEISWTNVFFGGSLPRKAS